MNNDTNTRTETFDHADFGVVNIGTPESARIVLLEEFQDEMDVRSPLLKLPGGRKKAEESPFQTVVREIYEEITGLTVQPRKIFFRKAMRGSNPHMFNVWTLTVPPELGIEHLPLGDGIRKIVVVSEPLLASMLAAKDIIAPVHAPALTKYLFLPMRAR